MYQAMDRDRLFAVGSVYAITGAAIIAVLTLGSCAPAPGQNPPLLSNPAYQAAQMCQAYATGLDAATARANAGQLTPTQDAAVDQIVTTYGPMCDPVVRPDAYLHADAMIAAFSTAGVAIAMGR